MLYRYLDSKHVDLFKQKGLLRISPFTKYHEIDDIRKDETEAKIVRYIRGPGTLTKEQAKKFLGVDVHSLNMTEDFKGEIKSNIQLPPAYILSLSTTKEEHLKIRFGCDDFFTIYDKNRFGNLLAKKFREVGFNIPGVAHNKISYLDKEKYLSVEELLAESDNMENASINNYFLKPKEYEIESEYRFVVPVYTNKELKPIDLFFSKQEIKDSCIFTH